MDMCNLAFQNIDIRQKYTVTESKITYADRNEHKREKIIKDYSTFITRSRVLILKPCAIITLWKRIVRVELFMLLNIGAVTYLEVNI